MTKIKLVMSSGFVVGAVVLSYAQADQPKNLAGAEFPCTYNKPVTHNITAKFLETVNDVTFATNFEIQTGNMTLRAENAMCDPNGECALTGKVTVTLTKPSTPTK